MISSVIRPSMLLRGIAMAGLLAGCAPADGPSEAARATASARRGELAAVTTVAVIPKAATDAANAAAQWQALTGPALCDVTVKSIVHGTVGPKGGPARVSGALLVPGGECRGPFPLVAYARGTETDRRRTMASTTDRETQLLIGMLAARGYVVVATDYLGYAQSDFPYHPYLDADSEASTVIDSIRAARNAAADAGVPLNGRVLLTGYSQGGHAALAAHRAIERDAPPDLGIDASGPMSGPYDLALTFVAGASVLPSLASDGTTTGENRVRIELADLVSELAVAFGNGPVVGELTRRQSVIGWRPVAPVLLCGGSRDLVVGYANTQRAAADFRARGATGVTVVDVEQEPSFAPMLPPADAPAATLTKYHAGVVPPLCLQIVRDRQFAAYR